MFESRCRGSGSYSKLADKCYLHGRFLGGVVLLSLQEGTAFLFRRFGEGGVELRVLYFGGWVEWTFY